MFHKASPSLPDTALRIRLYPDEILRTVCTPITEFDENIVLLGERMKTFAATYECYGVSAPQVGSLHRMFIMEERDTQYPKPGLVVCNPSIFLSDAKEFNEEGCLSVPALHGQVERSVSLTMMFHDVFGVSHDRTFSGLQARIIQHEVDHLNGIMYFDHMPRNPRRQILRELDARSTKKGRP